MVCGGVLVWEEVWEVLEYQDLCLHFSWSSPLRQVLLGTMLLPLGDWGVFGVFK